RASVGPRRGVGLVIAVLADAEEAGPQSTTWEPRSRPGTAVRREAPAAGRSPGRRAAATWTVRRRAGTGRLGAEPGMAGRSRWPPARCRDTSMVAVVDHAV